MSLQRFQQLREEHGALDEASQATQQDVVKRSFSTFYLVTSVLQFLLLLAALVFYSSTFSDDTSGTILICISNQTMFSSIYSFATSADVFLLNDTFICVPEQNDTILYMVIGGLAMCLCLAGLFCHLYLPTDHPSLPRVDVAVVVLVYYLNVIGPFGMVFTSGGGQTYLLFSLHGARTGLGVGCYMTIWKCVVATLPFNNFGSLIGTQLSFFLFDLALVIPGVVIVPNLDLVWFFALDTINVGQLIFSAAKRSALEAQSLAVHVKHVRMQALKFGAAEEEIVDLLLEECKLSDKQVENRKIPWRLQDSAFRIGKRLGSGTQANVYAALYQGAPVALKVMTVSNCRENLRELAVEASTLWSLQKHPFLLTFFGVSRVVTPDHGRRVCLVFEYCPRTLEDALHSSSDPWVVEPGVVLLHQAKVLRQIASAMACLHHADIQHRDLKPDNVFFGFDGDIRIADFGVANKSTTRIKGGAIRGDYGGRNSIEMMGTPGYITPVLLRLQNGTSKPGDVCENIDTFNFERHDAFAFVVLGIFVLRGSLPYDDDASSSRLLDPQYVQFCVEAALEADDISSGFRDCLADLYRASSKSSERVDFASVRDEMFRLPPTSECTMVFNFDQSAESQQSRQSHAGSFTMTRSSSSLPLMSVNERQTSIQMAHMGTI